MMKTRALLLGTLISIACMASAADVYKWVDATGQTQYSDQPPPASVKRDVVRIHKSGGVVPAQTAVAARANGDNDQKQKDGDSAEQNDPAAERAAAREACKRATEHLQSIEDAPSHATTDDKGKERELSAAEVNQLLATARKDKAQICGRVR